MDKIPISTHLHMKPWQVAVTNDKSLPLRKWNHLGTIWAVSAKSAAYAAYAAQTNYNGTGTMVSEDGPYQFSTGEFFNVH